MKRSVYYMKRVMACAFVKAPSIAVFLGCYLPTTVLVWSSRRFCSVFVFVFVFFSQAEALLAAEIVAGRAEKKRAAARTDAVVAERDRGLEQASAACRLPSDLFSLPLYLWSSVHVYFLFSVRLLFQGRFLLPQRFDL